MAAPPTRFSLGGSTCLKRSVYSSPGIRSNGHVSDDQSSILGEERKKSWLGQRAASNKATHEEGYSSRNCFPSHFCDRSSTRRNDGSSGLGPRRTLGSAAGTTEPK